MSINQEQISQRLREAISLLIADKYVQSISHAAEVAGADRSFFNNVINGKKPVSRDSLLEWCNKLGLDFAFIVDERGGHPYDKLNRPKRHERALKAHQEIDALRSELDEAKSKIIKLQEYIIELHQRLEKRGQ